MSKSQQKTRIKPNTLRLIRKRSEWRKRAINAATELATYPAGKPDRERIEAECGKAISKIRIWFKGGRRAELVIAAVQRRAVFAFRQQSSDNRK